MQWLMIDETYYAIIGVFTVPITAFLSSKHIDSSLQQELSALCGK